jgi:flagellar biogenesis protein FliO
MKPPPAPAALPSPRTAARLLAALRVAGFLAATLAAWAADAPAAGTSDPALTPVPLPPAVPDVSLSFLRTFGALGLVLALFFGGVWLFRNWQRGTGSRGRPARLQILEVRSLGARQALFVVGYDRERLLVASSPGGITLLDRLPTAGPGEPVDVAPPASFADTLRQLLQPR